MIDASTEVQRVAGSAVPVLYGRGSAGRVGEEASKMGRRVLVVSDPGLVAAGHAGHVMADLKKRGVEAELFAEVGQNPTTEDVARGLAVARKFTPEVLVALGGGSAMDTAKGINFLYTNGGEMADYRGVGKATKEMLPLIAVPTTAGTGSEAQCAALITDARTHQKMACLDKKVLPRLAILDSSLLATCPRGVRAATGLDAIAHAVETAATTKRNAVSREFSKLAWRKLEAAFSRFMQGEETEEDRDGMLLGAHLAGCAIESSMLGAGHSCANPLTEQFGITHGIAVGIMLPHVVRKNTEGGENHYADICEEPERLAAALGEFLAVAGVHARLRAHGVTREAAGKLAEAAAGQWTATFNPRKLSAADFRELYERAW